MVGRPSHGRPRGVHGRRPLHEAQCPSRPLGSHGLGDSAAAPRRRGRHDRRRRQPGPDVVRAARGDAWGAILPTRDGPRNRLHLGPSARCHLRARSGDRVGAPSGRDRGLRPGHEHGDPLRRPGRVRPRPQAQFHARPPDRALQPQRARAAPRRARRPAEQREERALARSAALRSRPLQAGQRPARTRRRRPGPAGRRLHDALGSARRRLDLQDRRRGDPRRPARRRQEGCGLDCRAPAQGGARAAPGRDGGDDQHRRRGLQAGRGQHRRPGRQGRRGSLLGEGERPRHGLHGH